MRRQRGWVGLIVLLLALAIVAILAQTVLKQYGLFSGETRASKAASSRGLGVGAAPVDPTMATPTPANALERARGVESTLQRQTQEMGKNIDEQTK